MIIYIFFKKKFEEKNVRFSTSHQLVLAPFRVLLQFSPASLGKLARSLAPAENPIYPAFIATQTLTTKTRDILVSNGDRNAGRGCQAN